MFKQRVVALLGCVLAASAARLPATCQEIAYKTPTALDGEYELDCTTPVTVYCHGLSTSTPKEFLSLNTDESTNYGEYFCGSNCHSHPNVSTLKTVFSKIRINPCTFLVDVTDYTFANSTGQIVHRDDHMLHEAFGVAESCEAGNPGTANIDLSKVPFTIESQWKTGGASPFGHFSLDPSKQKATITGGGFCGHNAPEGWNAFAPRNVSQWVLQLAPRTQ